MSRGETRGYGRALRIGVVLGVTSTLVPPLGLAADASGELGEVLVTARKRAESLQDVPVAVSAVTAEAFERQQVSSLRDINFSVPNLSAFNNQTTVVSSATFIRGVGQDDSTPVQEQGVATYVDDVYLPRAQGGLLDLIDFERVEVLRGPQGTLYGRNSPGGALKFVTRKPSLTDSSVLAQVTIGSFDRADLGASFSSPLVEDRLAAKVDFVSRDRDGYITQASTGNDVSRIDRETGRLALRWQAADSVLVDWSMDATRDRSGLQGGTAIAPQAGGSLPGGYAPVFGGLYVTGADVPDLNEFDGWGTAATLTWDSQFGQLKAVSSYRRWSTEFWSDLGGRPANLDLFSDMAGRTFTQEIQLTSSGESRLNWVVGLFYMQEKLDILNEFLFFHDYIQETDAAAVYGEGTLSLTDRLRVTLGGRYSQDDKSIDMDAIGIGGTFSARGLSEKFTDFTPKIAVDFSLSDTALMYVSAQEGYKAGAFQGFPQQLTDLTQEILQPESVRAYEIGAKTEWLDRSFVVNAAAFLSDYSSKQVNIFNPATLGFVSRTADAEMYGIELEWAWRANDVLTLNGFVATFHGEITETGNDPLVPPEGTQLPFMPDVSAKAGFDWRIPAATGGEFFVGGNVAYTGTIDFAVFNEPFVRQDPYTLLDARVGYRTAGGRFELAVGGRNLTDEEYAFTAAVVDGGTLWMAEPRTWSLSFRYRLQP